MNAYNVRSCRELKHLEIVIDGQAITPSIRPYIHRASFNGDVEYYSPLRTENTSISASYSRLSYFTALFSSY